MNKTKNDMPEALRTQVVELLNARLSDAIELRLQTKQAHWNVKGPNFIALHKLFDELYDEVGEHVDDLAERLVALGGVAEGLSSVVAKKNTLPAYPLADTDWRQHVDALSTALAAFGKQARAGIDQSDKLGDKDTADLFTGISRDIDKALWMVEAHLEK